MTTSAEGGRPVVVDTNVLLAATDRSRARHSAATDLLATDDRDLAITPQVVREYLAVATRPVEANGLGMDGPDAVANAEQLLTVLRLLPEGPAATARLLDLVGRSAAQGRQVHDANVVAVALAHGASAIVTDDARHFSRFSSMIAIERLDGDRT